MILFEIKNLSYSYKKKKAIDNISLNIESGFFWGIVGPNGCGKTTFLDLLIGYKKPDSGNIKYKGKEISKYKKREISKEISLVPQEFHTDIPFTVEEVVFMGRYPYLSRFSNFSPEDIKIIDHVIKLLELESIKKRCITELSGGEKQRVIFARALAQDTPVLLLDEAISNMDIKHKLKILDILKEKIEKEKKTIIMTMHDINLAALYADKLIMMKTGKVVAYGNTEEIIEKETINFVFEVGCYVYKEKYSQKKQVYFKRNCISSRN